MEDAGGRRRGGGGQEPASRAVHPESHRGGSTASHRVSFAGVAGWCFSVVNIIAFSNTLNLSVRHRTPQKKAMPMPHTFNQPSPQNAPLPAHNLYLCHSLSCVTALQVACPILLSLLLSLCFSSFSIFCSLSSLPLLSGSIKKKIDPFAMCLFCVQHPKNHREQPQIRTIDT